MKKLLCKIGCTLQMFGAARAASILARQGRHAEAKEMMIAQQEACKC